MSDTKTQREIAADITVALIEKLGQGYSNERLPSAAAAIAESYKVIYAAVAHPEG